MVRNLKGGNKSKKGARKNLNAGVSNVIRYAQDESELYASVVRLFGGNICQVRCGIDGITRQCIIRNKFRGRNKRNNTIQQGVWVLVGLREWENKTGEQQKCDLLEVYNENEKDKLKQTLPEDILPKQTEKEQQYDINSYIEFVDDKTMEYSKMIDKEFNEMINTNEDTSVEKETEEIISIDDI